jgi:hypothetical protein
MAATESESLMAKEHNWIVQLCEYHAVKFSADYWAFRAIKDALSIKDKCSMCKLDMPLNIKRVDIILEDEN